MADRSSINQERERRILSAAADLITHYGYDKTTISDIAQAAGISKGAVYLHFKSKEDLLDALLRYELSQYSQQWLERIEQDSESGTFVGLYRSSLYALNENPFMAAIMKKDRRVLGSYLQSKNNIFRDQRLSLRYEFVRTMQEAGAIRSDISPQIVAYIMNMLSYALISMDDYMPADEIPPFETVIEGIGSLLDRALTPEDGNREAGKIIIRQIITAVQQMLQNTP